MFSPAKLLQHLDVMVTTENRNYDFFEAILKKSPGSVFLPTTGRFIINYIFIRTFITLYIFLPECGQDDT